MAYIKQNFTDGVVLEAHHLNNIEDQIAANEAAIEGKADKEHTHNYAGSSSAGGSALSAEKVNNALTINVMGGSAVTGVYDGSEAMEFDVCSPFHTHDNVVSLDDGIRIAAETDLNTIVDIGNYRCTDPKTSKTLLNCPTVNSFKMTVAYSSLMSGGTYKIQEIVDLYQREFYRRTVDDGVTWTEWVIRDIGLNTSIDIGEVEYNRNTKNFTDEMNRIAARIGMTNSSFNTACGFDDYITAHDLLRLLIAAKHTPTVYQVMGTKTYRAQKNNAAIAVSHIVLENTKWKNWASKNNYTLLATKGGSFRGVVNGTSLSIMNNAMLIKDNNNKTYGLTVVGVENPKAWLETITYSKYERVKVDITDNDGNVLETHYYMSLTDKNLNNEVTNTTYWQEVESEAEVIRTLMHDMIEFLNKKGESQAMKDAAHGVNRRNPVSMMGVILTDDGNFEDDIAQLDASVGEVVSYNSSTVRFAASTTKIMTAIALSSYLDNHFCSVVNEDIIGGSGHAFVAGDTISTNDALYMMMLLSDNTMANMLARDCGRRMSGVTKEWVTNEIAGVSGTVSETWVNDQIQTAVTQKADKVHTHTEYATSSHNHSMSDITSGTLSLSQGGTGTSVDLTNAPVNAVIRKASEGYNSLYYTATKNGAYYATSENGAPKFGILPIAQGGTGATTPAQALKNLYPTLTTEQKKAMKQLMNEWWENRNYFHYEFVHNRDKFVDGGCYESQHKDSDDTLRPSYMLNCATFVQHIMMGRSVFDFSVAPSDYKPTINRKFPKETHPMFYYFKFRDRKFMYRLVKDANETENPGDKYWGWTNEDKSSYTDSYSYNSYYSTEPSDTIFKQNFQGFCYANDMAKELWEMGCEIPISVIDVGDIVFFHDLDPTDDAGGYNKTAWRNITHVGLVYEVTDEHDVKIIDCTVDDKTILIRGRHSSTATSYSDAVCGGGLMRKVAMVARMPIAFGYVDNVPLEIEKMETPQDNMK